MAGPTQVITRLACLISLFLHTTNAAGRQGEGILPRVVVGKNRLRPPPLASRDFDDIGVTDRRQLRRLLRQAPASIRHKRNVNSFYHGVSKRNGNAIPAVVVPPVVQNLARGSILKCLADLTGGLPLEVWKSSVVLEHIHSRQSENSTPPPPSLSILRTIVHEQGVLALWSGLAPRMIEGLFSGAVLLAAKEGLHTILSEYASPLLVKKVGLAIPPSTIGFVSGAGGGMAQALVMGPTSLVVTACVAASKKSEEPVSAWEVAKTVVKERGIRGLYRGAPAVAMRQATNWASRQGFTEWVRPRIPVEGVFGELLAGCIGGTLSAWNTPFEVARIESQSRVMANDRGIKKSSAGKEEEQTKGKSLVATMCDIADERGIGALYVGIIPRAAQACYQTLFLVCVPRLLPTS